MILRDIATIGLAGFFGISQQHRQSKGPLRLRRDSEFTRMLIAPIITFLQSLCIRQGAKLAFSSSGTRQSKEKVYGAWASM